MGLFERVLRSLFPVRETEAQVASLSEEELFSRLSPLHIPHETEHIVALLPYKDPVVSALIIETKYHKNSRASALLGTMLGSYLKKYVDEQDTIQPKDYVLVPVPLSTERFRERGYNQTELLTHSALTFLGIAGTPSTDLLKRIRHTESQTHLARGARLANLLGAFSAAPLLPSCTYMLIDDVVTTGATFTAAAGALRAAGARDILCVALAH